MTLLDLLIRTHAPILPDEIGALNALGLRLVTALSPLEYRFRGNSDAALGDIAALPFVAEVGPFPTEEKLDSGLKDDIAAAAVAEAMGLEALSELNRVRVLVSLDPLADPAATLAALAQLGEVVEPGRRRAVVEVSPDQIAAVAALPGVLAAEREPEHRAFNNIARGLIGVTAVAPALALDGSGEIVGVADSGLDTGVNNAALLPDFAGRVVNIRATVNKAAFGVANGADLNNHGTHVSGSILGSGANSNGNLAGMAPAARLTILSMGPNNSSGLSVPADLTTGVFQSAYNDGARLHNNSWGSNAPNAPYTAHSDDVDTFVRDNPDILILIAAGNSGPGASTIGAPGTAKNCLTVGASESVRPLPATISISPNNQDHDFNPQTPKQPVPLTLSGINQQADDPDHIASFSSRGPTADGRIKPDIVAPGTWILSSRSSVSTADVGPDGFPHVGSIAAMYANDADGIATHAEAVGRGLPGGPFYGTWNQTTPDAPPGSGAAAQENYFYSSGTSMATPVTTGAAALLRQYLREQRGIANPSAALMKAFLVNGATVPTGASNTPDNNRGFGWLNLPNTLTPPPTGRQTYVDDVNLAVTTGDVRTFQVQIADPAHPFRVTLVYNDAPGSGIQNRLYLRVIDPLGSVTDGDVTPFPTVSNNVQRVHVTAPMPGTWTIEVHGVQVLFGIDAFPGQTRQDFALAIINGIGFTPQAVEVVQIIDRSGSMDWYGYLEPAKERASQFVDLLRIGDAAGVVGYDHAASTVQALTAVSGLGAQTAIKAGINSIIAGGATSIGGGLAEAGTVIAVGNSAQPQAYVLLSDGHENTPPWVGGGVADSPPAWYGGPDFSEALPNVPAGVRIYTVALGAQTNMALLQAIAQQTGGVFHAIQSPADTGKLHEIYVHLQALAGGEAVIASGSSSVDGAGAINEAVAVMAPAAAPLPQPVDVDGALLADLAGLAVAAGPDAAASGPTLRTHAIPVDETIESLTLLVSWPDPAAAVVLDVIGPDGLFLAVGSNASRVTGSTYTFCRVENPAPGTWQMVVAAAGGGERAAPHAYTWGALARTPLDLVLDVERPTPGATTLRVAAAVRDPREVVRSTRVTGSYRRPLATTEELLQKHAAQLAGIHPPFEPDDPRQTPALYALPMLDAQRRARGEGTVFTSQRVALRLTRTTGYEDAIVLGPIGLYSLRLYVLGRTAAGHNYRRERQLDVVV